MPNNYSRLRWERGWCPATEEEELRRVTGGRTEPALLGKATQCPCKTEQQPTTWTGKCVKTGNDVWKELAQNISSGFLLDLLNRKYLLLSLLEIYYCCCYYFVGWIEEDELS